MKTILLTPDEALAYATFQKHHALIRLLDGLGVFDIRSGSCEIHFNSMGGIGSVDVRRHYRPPVDK